jgi:hypothetical protein
MLARSPAVAKAKTAQSQRGTRASGASIVVIDAAV